MTTLGEINNPVFSDVDSISFTQTTTGTRTRVPDVDYATSEVTAYLVSGSANDVATTGSGARTVDVVYWDGDLTEHSTTVSMNGTTDVQFATDFYLLKTLDVATAGSGLINAGAISVIDTGATHTYATMPADYGHYRFPVIVTGSEYGYIVNASANFSNANDEGYIFFVCYDKTNGLKFVKAKGVVYANAGFKRTFPIQMRKNRIMYWEVQDDGSDHGDLFAEVNYYT